MHIQINLFNINPKMKHYTKHTIYNTENWYTCRVYSAVNRVNKLQVLTMLFLTANDLTVALIIKAKITISTVSLETLLRPKYNHSTI